MFLTPECSKHLVLFTVFENCQVQLCDCLFIVTLTGGQMNTGLTAAQTANNGSAFSQLSHTFLYPVVTDNLIISQFQHTFITEGKEDF